MVTVGMDIEILRFDPESAEVHRKKRNAKMAEVYAVFARVPYTLADSYEAEKLLDEYTAMGR